MAKPKPQNQLLADTYHESLWAVSGEGIVWQINPLSRQAAPVLNLAELAPEPRLQLQQEMAQLWMGWNLEEAHILTPFKPGNEAPD